MTAEQWTQVSKTLDFILRQPTGAEQGIRGKPEKPKRVKKPKQPKQEQPAEQLRMF